MKKIITIVASVGLVLSIAGCGGGGSSGNTNINNGNRNPTGATTNNIKPGPFSKGQFGDINLTSSYKIPSDAIFLDIRNDYERQEWQENKDRELALGSIGGAVYEYRTKTLPKKDRYVRNEFVSEVEKIAGSKHQKLILICNTNSRTKKAAKLLSDNGFTNVYQINGGMHSNDKYRGWQASKLPTGIYKNVEVDRNYKIPNGTKFIDIRNPWEMKNNFFAKGSIGGAIYEYRKEAEEAKGNKKNRQKNKEFTSNITKLVDGNKNQPIILICHTGSRTSSAVKRLVEAGFTNVGHVVGGLSKWKSTGLPMGN